MASSISLPCLLAATAFSFLLITARAATPFTQATVTRVQKDVNYGEIKAGRTATRRAAVADIVRATNFLLTETESRAELQYEDGSVVRIGQNTVFSFDAESRTLALEKGSLIFYIPKGSGGGQIKTPSLTAAITGTVGKVSENIIAIIVGEARVVPSGEKVPAGSFVRRNANGSLTVDKFQGTGVEGKLMTFNGPMPGVDERKFAQGLTLGTRGGERQLMLDLSQLDTLDAVQTANSDPGANREFFPEPKPQSPSVIENKKPVFVPPPVRNRPPPTPTEPPLRD